jgi:hypothetical protein
MAWNSNLKKGTDLPTWDWLSFFPTANSYPGTCLAYDGIRYAYGSMQTGSTATTTSGTTTLWRYDTWADAWQLLSTATASTAGADCIYDPVRNVFWTTQGLSATTWNGFNLNPTFPATSNQVVATGTSGTNTITVVGGANTGSIKVGMYAAGTLGTVTVAGSVTAISGNVITLSNNHTGSSTGTGLVAIGNTYATVITVSGSGTSLTISGTWSSSILTGSVVINTTTAANIPTGAVVLSGQGTSTLTISKSVTSFSGQTVAFFQPHTLENGATAVAGLGLSPYSNVSMTPILPSGATNVGSSMVLVEDVSFGDTMATGTVHSAGAFAGSGATSVTSFTEAVSSTNINIGHVGCGVRFTGTSAPSGMGVIQSVAVSRGSAVYSSVVGTAGTNTLTLQTGYTATTLGLSVGMSVSGIGIDDGSVVTQLAGSLVTLSKNTISGISSTISSSAIFIADNITVTIAGGGLSGAPTVGNTYFVEYPQGLATATFATTTLVDSTQNWIANTYRDSDVIITSGTGAGQRRRIASNTSTTLTLSSATTGNTRTGPWTTQPASDSTYKIVPSSDFLYYIPGNAATIYRIDLNTNNNDTTWSSALTNNGLAIQNFTAGSTLMHGKKTAPFSLFATRGTILYRYDIGAQGWSTVNTTAGYAGVSSIGNSDSLAVAGATAAVLYDNNRIAVHVTGSTRLYAIRLADGFIEPLTTLPYAAPVTYDGRRMFYAKSIDGVPWLYFQRAGGGEFYRCALEWY